MVDAEHQILLLKEKLSMSDNYLSEDKNNLLKLTNNHNQDLEKKLLEFNKDRKELSEKIEKLNSEKNGLKLIINKKE